MASPRLLLRPVGSHREKTAKQTLSQQADFSFAVSVSLITASYNPKVLPRHVQGGRQRATLYFH